MLSKPLLLVAASVASLCMIATTHAQSPFADCPSCQLKAAAVQRTPVIQRIQTPQTFVPQSYSTAAPIQMARSVQLARPVQYAPQYSVPQISNFAPRVISQPVYSSPVYRAPVQAYRPVYRSYAPAVHSGSCGRY